MIKEKDLHGSIWIDNEGDMMKIEKVKSGYYGRSNEFDFEAKTSEEVQKKLKNWEFRHIGWE